MSVSILTESVIRHNVAFMENTTTASPLAWRSLRTRPSLRIRLVASEVHFIWTLPDGTLWNVWCADEPSDVVAGVDLETGELTQL